MATSRFSNQTNLSSNVYERQQVQARIRSLQQRTNALYDELSRSSFITKSAAYDIERAYTTIINELREQRDQLLRHLHRVKQNIKQSTTELDHIHKNLDTAQSFRLPQSTPRYSNDHEVQEMNAIISDIERLLNNIAHQLKQVRFIPSNVHLTSKTLGTIDVKDSHPKQIENSDKGSSIISSHLTINLSISKLYTVDLDISAQWIVSSLDGRIFLCDAEGEIRIFSYSRQLRRQPLLTERFHISTNRRISSFTVTKDYLIAFEIDTQMLTLHTHHGALLQRSIFLYEPIMIIRCDYKTKNQIWTCNRTKKKCYQFQLNHSTKQIDLLDQLDFTNPISNVHIDPIDLSTDEQDRIAVHDINTTTLDRLILFTSKQNRILPLHFITYDHKPFSSRIERIVLVPHQPHLLILVYAPEYRQNPLREIVIIDIQSNSPKILYRLSETNGVQNLDITLNNEFVYTVTTPANKRSPPKMHIYSLFN